MPQLDAPLIFRAHQNISEGAGNLIFAVHVDFWVVSNKVSKFEA